MMRTRRVFGILTLFPDPLWTPGMDMPVTSSRRQRQPSDCDSSNMYPRKAPASVEHFPILRAQTESTQATLKALGITENHLQAQRLLATSHLELETQHWI